MMTPWDEHGIWCKFTGSMNGWFLMLELVLGKYTIHMNPLGTGTGSWWDVFLPYNPLIQLGSMYYPLYSGENPNAIFSMHDKSMDNFTTFFLRSHLLRGAIFIQNPWPKTEGKGVLGCKGEKRYETTDTSAVCGFLLKHFLKLKHKFVDTSFFEALLKHFCWTIFFGTHDGSMGGTVYLSTLIPYNSTEWGRLFVHFC